MKKLAMGAVLGLALAAAGCGGGGGGGTLSKAEYSTKLNKICSDFNAKQKEIGEPNSLEDLVDKGPKLVDEFDKAIAEVKKLKPPDEIKDAADRFISIGEQERDLIGDLIDAAKKKDETKIAEISSRGNALDRESNDIAKNQLGAPACTQG